ncbi:MAG: ATP-binding protein [Candidatus Jordarchaeum sp.]|uniref:ATP-binding protein n=1 Tax=Candidatus Jordarchaeum sp. TaxID=2823881 RepID=UPI00404ACBC4
MIRFIDRVSELTLLESEWSRNCACFVILYGRRRIGKTRLILEFIKGKKGIFYIAEDISKKAQIDEVKKVMSRFFEDSFLERVELKEWRDLFEYLTRIIPKNEKLLIVIDEFSYLIRSDKTILSALQKFWDTFLANTKVFLLISGSLLGLMSEQVLSSASPLYGRRTRDILLEEMRFESAREFLERMNFEEQLKTSMTVGGVPEYLLRAREYNSLEELALQEFLRKDGYFYREPYFLLSQDFKEIKTYFTILNAIAYGNTKPTEIANFAGIRGREVYPYLENLIRLGLVERLTPIGEPKRGIYLIRNPLLDFWFNFVFKNRQIIEMGSVSLEDVGSLAAYYGKRFEILIRDDIFHRIFKFQKVGKWWHKEEEVDLVAFDESREEMLFAECKWQENVNAKEILEKLREQTNSIRKYTDKRRENYVVFAKSFKKRVKEENTFCYDINDLENLYQKP